jgi:HD superfamily phosphodiesterase
MNIPVKLKNEILKILDQSDLEREGSHGENTLYWVKKIKPDASLSLQISALAHDIERGVAPRYKSGDFEDHGEYKKVHSEKGAKIIGKILEKHNIDNKTIDEVKELVRLHETGGNVNADILMDADSISFFDNNLEFYYSYKGLEGTLRQIDYKFKRCSPRAQKHIKSLKVYQSFKKKLNTKLNHYTS